MEDYVLGVRIRAQRLDLVHRTFVMVDEVLSRWVLATILVEETGMGMVSLLPGIGLGLRLEGDSWEIWGMG